MNILKSFGYLLGFLAILFVSEISEAGDKSGYYVRGDIGYGFPNDQEQVNGSGVASTNESNDEFVKFGIGLGYDYEGPMRTELSFSYSPDMDNSGNSTGATTTNGSIENYLFMVNAYYDFDGVSQGFIPYVGGGIGLSRNVSDDGKIANAAGTVNLTEGGAGKNNLGWALGFGTAVQTDGNVTVDMGYRYVAMGEAQGSGVFSGTPAQAPNGGVQIDDAFVHELYLGLRVGF